MTVTPSEGEVQEAVVAIGRLGMALTEAMHQVPVDEVAVSNAGVITLFQLARIGPLRPHAIAELVGFTTGGATKLLDRLEATGLLRRVGGAHADQRAVSVEITEPGLDWVRRMVAEVVARLPEVSEAIRKVAALLEPLE